MVKYWFGVMWVNVNPDYRQICSTSFTFNGSMTNIAVRFYVIKFKHLQGIHFS